MRTESITVERVYEGTPYQIRVDAKTVVLYVNRTKVGTREHHYGALHFYQDTEQMLRECGELIEAYRQFHSEVTKELMWIRDYLRSLMPQPLEEWMRRAILHYLAS